MLRYLKADIPVQKIFRISWIANTLNGFIGFGGLVGAGCTYDALSSIHKRKWQAD